MNRLNDIKHTFKTPFVIADIGSNWKRFTSDEDNLACAKAHIQAAARCGVSAVKFQLFTHEELYGLAGEHKWALPREWLAELAKEADKRKVEFMCTAFSAEGVRAVDPFVRIHKIASAELLDPEIGDACFKTGKPVIVSTGGKTEKEVFAFLNKYTEFSERIAVLECVAAYPANTESYNLTFLAELSLRGLSIGVSDHTRQPYIAIAAQGVGATVFETHFYSVKDNDALTPDWPHSLNEHELREYVRALNEVEKACSKTTKTVDHEEVDMVLLHNRRLVATQDIEAGAKLSIGENCGSFRSLRDSNANGLSPLEMHLADGKKTRHAISAGATITFMDFVKS